MQKKQRINDEYVLNQLISESTLSSTWQGEHLKTGKKVTIQFLKENAASQRIEDHIRFKNEVAAINRMKPPFITRITDFGKFSSWFYRVYPYQASMSLEKYLNNGYSFSISQIFEITIALCIGLSYLHRKNILHRNIKPGKVLLNLGDEKTNSLNVSLIDCGMYNLIKFDALPEKELLENFYYVSPEQCGTFKKDIDERSDLYSLGVLLYRLLAGTLPFESNDINGLIYNHRAVIPTDIREKAQKIPPFFGELVMKLLEKEPEQRYQSAEGVLDDLVAIQQGTAIEELGLTDVANKLTYETKMIGREKELGIIKKSLKQMLLRNGSTCIVSGDIGTGKTRLLEEAKKYFFEHNFSFFSIQCHLRKQNNPYQVLNDVLKQYLQAIFKNKTEEEAQLLREKLNKKFYTMCQVIVSITPELEKIIGSFPPIKIDYEKKYFAHFMESMKDFFIFLTKNHEYFVVIIDDIHWIDPGSLRFFFEIAKDIPVMPFLAILSSRRSVLTPENLKSTFDLDINGILDVLHYIYLENFDESELNNFISHILHQQENTLKEITNYIYQKTKGNPFFTIEFIKHLIANKGLVQENRRWFLNGDKLKTIELPGTLLDSIVQQLTSLTKLEKKILSHASIIGDTFSLDILFAIIKINPEKIVVIIDKAKISRFIASDNQNKDILYFTHEQIQTFFYNEIEELERKDIHLKIARYYIQESKKENKTYTRELAYHYYKGGDYESGKPFIINASKEAEENYANDEAVGFCKMVISQEEKKGQKGSFAWLDCTERMGRIYMTIGKLDRALALFEEEKPYLKTRSDKISLYRQLSNIYFKMGDLKKVDTYARLGLAAINQSLPVSKVDIFFFLLKNILIHGLYTLFPWLPHILKSTIKREDAVNAIWIYWLFHSNFSSGGLWQSISTAIWMVNFAKKNIGPSKELGMSLMVYALTLSELTFFNSAEKNHLKALEMRTKHNDPWGIAHSNTSMGFLYKIKGDLVKAVGCFKESIRMYTQIGDIGHDALGAGTSGLAGAYLFLSEYDNAKHQLEKYMDTSIKLNSYWGQVFTGMHYATLYSEIGDFKRAEETGLKALETAKEHNDTYQLCLTHCSLGRAYYEKGDIYNSKIHLEKSLEIFNANPNLLLEYVLPVYPYLAETYILEYTTVSIPDDKTKQELLRKIKNICESGYKKTKKWKTLHGMALRAKARYYSLTGRLKKAEHFFNNSIHLCTRIKRRYEQGVSLYAYGTFLRSYGHVPQGDKKIEEAYIIFKDIGAKAYEKKLAILLGIKNDFESSSDLYIENTRHVNRLNTLISLSRDISSILNLQDLIDLAIEKAIEATSAYRGYIFLVDKKNNQLHNRISNSIDNEIEVVFCREIIDSVFDNHKSIVKTNISADENFAQNNVVWNHNLKSIICVPIQHGNNIEGICYLDNPLSVGVFSEMDAELLNVFMSQVAISIENARNYDKIDELNRSLEKKVAERTLELQQANRELSIKNKFKSNFLANMSHEIRTPLNSILGLNQQLLYDIFDSKQDIADINNEIIDQCKNPVSQQGLKKVAAVCKKFNTYFIDGKKNTKQYHVLLLKAEIQKLLSTNQINESDLADIIPLIQEQEEILTDEVESVKNNLQQIQKSGNYLLELVNSILDISKIEAGKVNLIIEEVELQPFIDTIITTAFSYRSSKSKDGKVEILFSISEDVPHTVLLDGKKIKQVLLNLMSNGIKFTDSGQVRLDCYIKEKENKLCFSVSDTGIGIPEVEVPLIFNEFERTSNAAEIEGTGLGLALSKRLVELHQGTIRFESEVNAGTTFYIELPLKS